VTLNRGHNFSHQHHRSN